MPTLLGADLIVKALAEEGITHVFTLPGGQMNPIHFAVDQEPGMRLIIPRHEGAGALMAAGFALTSGRPACVMTTVGAGIAYEIGALYLAWKERLPLISISPQVQSHKMKPIQENLQACDQDEIFKPITKFTAILYHRDRIPSLVRRAFKTALAPEPGPVHLDVPVDVIFGFRRVSAKKMKHLFPGADFRYKGAIYPDDQGLQEAWRLIGRSRKPLVLAGRHLDRSRAGQALEAFLQAADAPVISSSAAFAAVAAGYPLNLGSCWLWDNKANRERLAETDLLFLLEADEETARLTASLVKRNPGIDIVQTAELTSALGSIAPTRLSLCGSPRPILEALAESLRATRTAPSLDPDWKKDLLFVAASHKTRLRERLAINDNRLFSMVHAFDRLNAVLTADDLVVCEGPTVTRIAMVHLKHPGRHNCFLLDGLDVAGAGLPVALGARLARPEARVFLISETEMLKRHHREFQTQSRYQLGIVSLLFQAHEERPGEEVDFASLAKSLGVPARRIRDAEEEITDTLLTDTAAGPAGGLLDIMN